MSDIATTAARIEEIERCERSVSELILRRDAEYVVAALRERRADFQRHLNSLLLADVRVRGT